MITLGVDIGQKRDPTALALVEIDRRDVTTSRRENHHIVRYLGRLRLGTPYPEVADRVAEVSRRAREQTGYSPTIYIDATGVGQPVVDLIAERGCRGLLFRVGTHDDLVTALGLAVQADPHVSAILRAW